LVLVLAWVNSLYFSHGSLWCFAGSVPGDPSSI
jgi:hypothetical protein